MSKHAAFLTNKALAWIGGGGVLLGSAVTGTMIMNSSAATAVQGSSTPTESSGTPSSKNKGNGKAQPPPKALTVRHTMPTQVRLGSPGILRVLVTNPNSQAVDLTGVTGKVDRVDTSAGSGPVCTTSDLVISSSNAAQRIGKGATGDPVDLTVTMVENGLNQDRCKGATFHFSFTATANQA